MDSLITQLNRDLEELEELLKEVGDKSMDSLERQRFLTKLAWIKQGLETFQEMEQGEIEGVIHGRLL
jgi:hypothetical protein